MLREILKMGDIRLLQVARPVEDIRDSALKVIIADMYEPCTPPRAWVSPRRRSASACG
jgi:peptide deformylase